MRKWLLRCNLNGYDILQDFLENGSILYKTYDNIKKDDEVFIYGEKPLGAIFLKCIFVLINIIQSHFHHISFVIFKQIFNSFFLI